MKKNLILSLLMLLALQSEAGVTQRAVKLSGSQMVGGLTWGQTNSFGLGLQSLTTTQRNLITPGSVNWLFFNSDSAKPQYYNGSSWVTVGTGSGGGSGSFSVKESDVSVGSGITTIDFGTGFDINISPAGEVNVSPDYTENPSALAAFSTVNLGTLSSQTGQLGLYNSTSAFRVTLSSLPQTGVNKILLLPVQTAVTDTIATQSYVRSAGTGHTGDLNGTSQEITVSSSTDQIFSDATLSLAASLSLAGHTTFLVPQATTPTATLAGALVFDTDRLAPSHGAYIGHDGTARGFFPMIANTETPLVGESPIYQSDGTYTSDPTVAMNVALNRIPYADIANTSFASSLYYTAAVDTNPIFAAGWRSTISPALNPTSVFEGSHAKGNTNIWLRAYDNSGDGGVTQFIGSAIGGRERSPAATPNNTVMTRLAGRGYGSTAEVATSKAQINLMTTQAWTDANNGTKIQFVITPRNTATTVNIAELNQNGFRMAPGYSLRAATGLDSLTIDPSVLRVLEYKNNGTVVFSADTTGKIIAAQIDNGSGAFQIGKATTTSISLVTDGTGTGEVVLPDGSIGSAELADGTVALADMANIATASILGRATASSGVPEVLNLGSTIQVTSGTVAVVDNSIADAKLRQGTALTVIGRSANSTGNVADIQATASSAGVLRESGSTIGFGTVATAGIADGAITEAKQTLADNTTNDASTSKHGYLKKLDNTATHFIDGTGSWRALASTDMPALSATVLGVPTEFEVHRTADTTIAGANNTISAIGGMKFTVSSGVYYEFKFVIMYTSADATNGLELGLAIPAATVFSATAGIPNVTDAANAMLWGWITASGDSVRATSEEGTTQTYRATIEGFILPSAGGTVQLRASTEDGSHSIVIKQGTYGICKVLP